MAVLPEIQVSIVEHHSVFGALPRAFDVVTSVSGDKEDIGSIYRRVDAILDSIQESLPEQMADFEVVIIEVSYTTPQLDELLRDHLRKRPKLPSRWN